MKRITRLRITFFGIPSLFNNLLFKNKDMIFKEFLPEYSRKIQKFTNHKDLNFDVSHLHDKRKQCIPCESIDDLDNCLYQLDEENKDHLQQI